MNFIEKIILKIIKRKVANWFQLERSVAQMDNAIRSCEESPEKSWPNPSKIPGGGEVPFSLKNIPTVGLSLKSCINQGMQAIKTISKNPVQDRKSISTEQLVDFEEFARMKGIGIIGYAKLKPSLIFKERAVLYDNAIILIMEMQQEAISKAPSMETFKMVMSTYDTLGKITNLLVDRLRDMGFQAQASHPLGGLVLYPPLAVDAGLGWFGKHGLLITPRFGPRQRIAAIFVNIDNLPIDVNKTNDHSWIDEFCNHCGKCIKTCPANAILDQPIKHSSERKTHIIREKCLPVFVNQEGCSICIKECMFNQKDYYDLRKIQNRDGG